MIDEFGVWRVDKAAFRSALAGAVFMVAITLAIICSSCGQSSVEKVYIDQAYQLVMSRCPPPTIHDSRDGSILSHSDLKIRFTGYSKASGDPTFYIQVYYGEFWGNLIGPRDIATLQDSSMVPSDAIGYTGHHYYDLTLEQLKTVSLVWWY